MSPQEYARKTDQHEQDRQQAQLFVVPRPTRIDAYLGCVHPPEEDWLRDVIEATFTRPDLITIYSWSFPEEEAETDHAEFVRDNEDDTAYRRQFE